MDKLDTVNSLNKLINSIIKYVDCSDNTILEKRLDTSSDTTLEKYVDDSNNTIIEKYVKN